MAFTISRKSLFDIVQKAVHVVPSKTSIPMLLNFKLSFSGNVLGLTATDLDHYISLKTSAFGDEEFEVTVNAKKFADIIRELGDNDDVTIGVENNVLSLTTGASFSCRIAGADAADFPHLPQLDEGTNFSIDAAVFGGMVARASFATARDEARACLCGVLWEVEKSKTTMVSTDGHRLGCCSFTCDFDSLPSSRIEAILPQKTVSLVGKIVPAQQGETRIEAQLSGKYLVLKTDDVLLYTKLLEGPYPDYDKVIPRTNPRKVILSRSMLYDALRRVGVLSNFKTHLVKFQFSANQLELAVNNRDIGGDARQVIPVDYSGENFTIGFDASYFSEILSIVNTPNVELEMNTQISACLIHPMYDEKASAGLDDLYLIMPLRIIDE